MFCREKFKLTFISFENILIKMKSNKMKLLYHQSTTPLHNGIILIKVIGLTIYPTRNYIIIINYINLT